MFILRLTSDPSLHGLKTDDQFTIGRISSETVFLLLATAFLGVLGGIVYLAIRSRFPRKARPVVMGVLGAVVGGTLFIRPGGVDFTIVTPRVLSIVMFIALPAIYGVLLALLTERMLRPESFLQTSRAWPLGLLPLLPLVLTGPLGLGLILVVVAIWFVRLKAPSVRRAWASRQAVWAGRAVVAGGAAFATVMLVQDMTEVL